MNIFYGAITILITGFLLAPSGVFAANAFLHTGSSEVARGERVTIELRLDTQGEHLNAVEGVLEFSERMFAVESVSDGNSAINFWIENPGDTSEGIIRFSGITPGGISGANELLFSFVGRARGEGDIPITLTSFKALRNDGEGSEASITRSNLTLRSSGVARDAFQPDTYSSDIEPPEYFDVLVANDPALFEGRFFITFGTQDKDSGIAGYKVREGSFGWFSDAESPYELRDQGLTKKIFVKAIDNNGNERLVIVEPQNELPWYKEYIGILFILFIILISTFGKFVWVKFGRSSSS